VTEHVAPLQTLADAYQMPTTGVAVASCTRR
jgi:hypothetical protein